jgi:hypothetical protein
MEIAKLEEFLDKLFTVFTVPNIKGLLIYVFDMVHNPLVFGESIVA